MDGFSDIKIQNRETMHLQVCNLLREQIFQGKLKPGEPLLQEELAKKLGVSRMPVREALKTLELEGSIKFTPNGRAIVKLLSIEDIKEIYKLRSYLEQLAVGKSISKLNKKDITELERLVNEMEDPNKRDEFVKNNVDFHRLLMKYCTWDRLLSFIETLWNGFPQQTPILIKNQVNLSNKEHREILKSVKEMEIKKCSLLIEKHITRTGKSVVKELENKNIQVYKEGESN